MQQESQMSPLIRYSGLAFLTVEYLLEHLQLMSFMRMSLETGNTWNTDADDTWDALENLALRFEDSSHDALYWIGLALTLIVFFAYFILYPWIHRLHKENNSCFQWFIIFLDHIIFGCGFIPIVANLSPVWYCNSTGEMQVNTSIDCFDSTQTLYVVLSYFGISGALVLAGVVFPILKSERDSLERRWQYESYFYPALRLLQIGIVTVLAPVQLPSAGIYLNLALFIYLIIFESFKDVHVACMRAAILLAQFWIFICAVVANDSDQDAGSDMLGGWIAMLVIGYVLMLAKFLIFKRKTRKIPIERN